MNIKKTSIYIFFGVLCSVLAFSLIQRFTVSGKVVDAVTHKPIPDLEIELIQVDNGIPTKVKTDENGVFKRSFLIMGRVKIHIKDPRY